MKHIYPALSHHAVLLEVQAEAKESAMLSWSGIRCLIAVISRYMVRTYFFVHANFVPIEYQNRLDTYCYRDRA